MVDINLTQIEADALIALPKHRVDDTQWDYPGVGGISIPLVSADRREQFVLDLRRGGAPHRNPDGEEIGPPHLHLYREGFADKWAVPVPPDRFANFSDPWGTFEDFMRYCSVVEPPFIRRGLFT